MKQGDFSTLAKHYHNRPAYSGYLLEKLIRCVNDKNLPLSKLKVAEVGAGTGKLTQMLAQDFGLQIEAVEPNDAMRDEGIKATKGLSINWHKGSGEQTTLKSASADWLIMASSFHWTDPQKSLPEFARVLKGGSPRSSQDKAKHTNHAQIYTDGTQIQNNANSETLNAQIYTNNGQTQAQSVTKSNANTQNSTQNTAQIHANTQISNHANGRGGGMGYFSIIYNPRHIVKGSLFDEIELEIKDIIGELTRVSSGSQNVKNWEQILLSTGDFTDCFFMECDYTEVWSKERYLGAWHSVNDIQAQAGAAKWQKILQMIESKIKDLDELVIPYKIRAWTARKA